MATGALPIPGRDASTIEDPAKRELVSLALREDPSERPSADALLEKALELARAVAAALTARKAEWVDEALFVALLKSSTDASTSLPMVAAGEEDAAVLALLGLSRLPSCDNIAAGDEAAAGDGDARFAVLLAKRVDDQACLHQLAPRARGEQLRHLQPAEWHLERLALPKPTSHTQLLDGGRAR